MQVTQEAVKTLEVYTLQYLDECVPKEFCTHIKPVAHHLDVSYDIARAVLRGLTDKGFAFYMAGLFTEDGEVAGSGYGITDAGRQEVNKHLGEAP